MDDELFPLVDGRDADVVWAFVALVDKVAIQQDFLARICPNINPRNQPFEETETLGKTFSTTTWATLHNT